MLGGSIAGFASPGHDGKLFVSTMLPAALLLSLTRGIRDGARGRGARIAIVVGLALLSPHPQLFQYMLLAGGAFALYVAFADHGSGRGKLPRDVALKRLGVALGAVVVGLLIGADSVLARCSSTSRGRRAPAATIGRRRRATRIPIEETLNWYWPQFSGILDSSTGARNGIHFHSDYFGVVVLMLAGAAFGATRRKSFRRFWVGTGIVSLLWAYGGFTPFFHLIDGDRSRDEVFPRAEHDHLRHGVFGGDARRDGSRAAPRRASIEAIRDRVARRRRASSRW